MRRRVGSVYLFSAFLFLSNTNAFSTVQKKSVPIESDAAINIAQEPMEGSTQEDSPDCLPKDTKDSMVLEPGCFGFSKQKKAAFCVIGSSASDYAGQKSGSENWRLISLPEGLVSRQCDSFYEGKLPERALVLSQKEAAIQKMKDLGLSALPSAHTLAPRNTLDIAYPSGLILRLRFNQMFLKSRDVGCGEVHQYRDRISLFCPQHVIPSEVEEPKISILSNNKVLPIPLINKIREETIFLDEEEGLGTAAVYVLDHGRYLLISIEKLVGEPGASRGFYAATFIDVQRCRVIAPKEKGGE